MQACHNLEQVFLKERKNFFILVQASVRFPSSFTLLHFLYIGILYNCQNIVSKKVSNTLRIRHLLDYLYII